jgi:hypothetical protein
MTPDLNLNPQPIGSLTYEEAKARINALQKDAGWRKKKFDGDAGANTEFNELVKVVAKGPLKK